MTTANIFSIGKNSNVYGALESGSRSDSKQVAEEAAEIFGAVMNQMSQDLATMQSDEGTQEMVSSVSTDTDAGKRAYEYSPKEKRIEPAKGSDSNVQNEVVEQEVEQLTEDVVETVCEKFNVSREELLATMEELGISEKDLLMPDKLGQLVMELTGATDVYNLLTNSDFQAVLQEISGLEKETAASLEMNFEQFQETLQVMNGSAEEQQLVAGTETLNLESENQIADGDLIANELPDDGSLEEVLTNGNLDGTVNSELVGETGVNQNSTKNDEIINQDLTTDKTDDLNLKGEASEEALKEQLSEDELEVKKDHDGEFQHVSEQDDLAEETFSKKMNQSQNDDGQDQGALNGRNPHLNDGTAAVGHTTGEVSSNIIVEESLSEISYSSIDVDDLVQQFVEKTQLTVMENKTTMDMQLNPENLGKIYLHISTEEGNVHAQIMTTNEIVKEAMEAQLVTLRENLNQAGVKVDSVDVSVATHEFEQNLEQNSKQEEEQARLQEEISHTRRNINMNSLDELAGVLSEEEVLVAQMMRDHGNSVDFTA